MRKLTEGDVERLLKGAADWEPIAPPPPMTLPERRTRRVAHVVRFAGIGSLVAAVFAAGWQLAPRSAPAPLPSPIAVAESLPEPEPPPVSLTPVERTERVRLASAPQTETEAPKRPRRIERRVARASEEDEPEIVPRRPRRKRNWIGERKSEPIREREEYASYRYVLSSQPLPKDAVTLDDTHRVVPVVVTDRDEKTGELRLIPAAKIVSDSTESVYSLE